MDRSGRASSSYARAQHAFCGKNNDELSFEIGDIIAVTQKLEGGWWEGTLNGETGWFPVAYVTPIAGKGDSMETCLVAEMNDSTNKMEERAGGEGSLTQKQFISQVLESFLKKEGDYIRSLKCITEEYLAPLHASNVVSQNDFITTEGGISSIYALQASIFNEISSMEQSELSQQRIGGVLISRAVELKALLVAYCSNHPDAAEAIAHNSDELASFFASIDCDMTKFIQGLSEPFLHLSTYPVVLQELHRNMPESHADRGDIQRSVTVYRDLKDLCDYVRRQREKQLEFMRTPRVALFMSERHPGRLSMTGGAAVVREAEGEETDCDRTLALFTDCLVLCEMTVDGLDYELHELIPLPTLRLRRVHGKSILITNRVPDEITFTFASSYDMDRWMEALQQCGVPVEEEANGHAASSVPFLSSSSNIFATTPRQMTQSPQPIEVAMRQRKESPGSYQAADASADIPRLRNKKPNVEQQPAAMSLSTTASSMSPSSFKKMRTPMEDSSPLRFNHDLEMIMPDGVDEDERMETKLAGGARGESAFYMRHYPPYRSPSNTVDLGKRTVKMRKDQNAAGIEQGDAALLAIVEGYLGVGADEHQEMRELLQPQLIVAEEEKMLVEETIDGMTMMTEKSLVDVVYSMKDKLDRMDKEMTLIRSELEKEQKARRRLEESIKRNSIQMSVTPRPNQELN